MKKLLLPLFFVFVSGVAAAQVCAYCVLAQDRIEAIQKRKNKAIELKAKNQAEADKVGKSDSSIRIKLISNIFMLNLKVETLANEIQYEKNQMKEKDCKKCGFNI